MKNFGNSSRVRSQGVPKIFRTPMYRAHCAVIFAIAQLSHEVLTDFTYRNLRGFVRFPGDSTALVLASYCPCLINNHCRNCKILLLHLFIYFSLVFLFVLRSDSATIVINE